MANSPEILFLLVTRRIQGIAGQESARIGGLSLVGYKARSALQSRYCSRLIVSSDSAEIQAEADRHGAEMLFDRPAELATDTASSNDVVLHAMDWIETHERRRYDAIMLLEPSSPSRGPNISTRRSSFSRAQGEPRGRHARDRSVLDLRRTAR